MVLREKTPHGGDIQSYIERFGCEPLDYSANTNPRGLSPLARKAVEAALDTADRYPDPYCRILRNDLGEHEGIDPASIICGNGAADLIVRLVWGIRPKNALVTAPSFSEYEEALAQVACEIEHFPLHEEAGFAVTEGIVDRITHDLAMVFLCEPNNPTGRCTPASLLEMIAERCAQTGTVLVIDECFNGFLEKSEEQSMKHLVGRMPNLVILKAFTKLYGMAGMRLGYALCSDGNLLERIGKAGQHWPVSSLAQAAGSAALREDRWLEEAKALIERERKRLAAGLAATGAKVYPSSANYLFFRTASSDLHDRMVERGVLMRDCSNYRGLGPGYFRIAVRTEEENTRFLAILQDAVEASKGHRSTRHTPSCDRLASDALGRVAATPPEVPPSILAGRGRTDPAGVQAMSQNLSVCDAREIS